MSGRYVYAILPHDAQLPAGLTGTGGAPLALVSYRGLAAATSEAAGATLPATVSDALQHEETVEALRRAGPLLPVRFGTVLADEGAVTAALQERYEVLADDLRRLGDKVEMGLTVMWGETAEEDGGEEAAHTPAGADRPGTRYLEERLGAHRRRIAARERASEPAQALHAALQALALETRALGTPSERIVLRMAYLLLPSEVSRFGAAFEEARRVHPQLRCLLSGPWPPYSFVTAQSARPSHGGQGAAAENRPEAGS